MNEFVKNVNSFVFDIICITKTWLHESVLNKDIELKNHTLYRRDRGGRGEEIVIYVESLFRSTQINSINLGDAEQLWVSVPINSKTIVYGVLYRPPTHLVLNFCNTFEDALSEAFLLGDELICC